MYLSCGFLFPMFLVGVMLLTAVMLVVNWKMIRTRKKDWLRLSAYGSSSRGSWASGS